MDAAGAERSIPEAMSKRALILRLACFVTVYPLFYAVPLFVLKVVPLRAMKHLPP